MSLFASVLVKHGVQYGDRVLIYMPMIPEAIVAMLACARIGAVHSLIFGGFAARELATRITHSQVSGSTGVYIILSLGSLEETMDKQTTKSSNRELKIVLA